MHVSLSGWKHQMWCSHVWVMNLKKQTPKHVLNEVGHLEVFLFLFPVLGTNWMDGVEDVYRSIITFCTVSTLLTTHQSTIRSENPELWSSYTSLRFHVLSFIPLSETVITNGFTYKYLTRWSPDSTDIWLIRFFLCVLSSVLFWMWSIKLWRSSGQELHMMFMLMFFAHLDSTVSREHHVTLSIRFWGCEDGGGYTCKALWGNNMILGSK